MRREGHVKDLEGGGHGLSGRMRREGHVKDLEGGGHGLSELTLPVICLGRGLIRHGKNFAQESR
jgi:hypothetical protein